MKYKQLAIGCMFANGRNGIYEIVIIDLDGKRLPNKKLSFEVCRDKGLIKRWDHTRKLKEYLNTEEGNKWFDEVSTDFGW